MVDMDEVSRADGRGPTRRVALYVRLGRELEGGVAVEAGCATEVAADEPRERRVVQQRLERRQLPSRRDELPVGRLAAVSGERCVRLLSQGAHVEAEVVELQETVTQQLLERLIGVRRRPVVRRVLNNFSVSFINRPRPPTVARRAASLRRAVADKGQRIECGAHHRVVL